MLFQSINPNDLSVVAEHETMTDHQIRQVLELSEKAFKHWRRTSFTERAVLMNKVADLLREQKETHAGHITTEMGKVWKESMAEVEKSAQHCNYYAQNAEQFLREEFIQSEIKRSSVVFDPLGCVFAIMPWNFPYWQVFRYAAKALMAGNVTILKHAPNVCDCAKAITALFQEAGFPEGVFQTVIIDIPNVEAIVASDVIQGVTFTGSEMAGTAVGALAGKYIKKSVLELGGSDALLVLADADISRAAQVAVQSRMLNAGQACNIAKRFIVEEKVADTFLNEIIRNIRQLKQGDPMKKETDIGPLARIDLAEKLMDQVSHSVDQGARLLVEGNQDQCHIQPSLLVNVQPGVTAFDEELFGPVAAMTIVKSEQEAITLANQHRYGLDASIWTKDLDKAAHIARRLEVGGVFVNTHSRSDSRFPFGGVKKSGYGRELSVYGLKEFVNIKTLIIED